MRTLLQRVSSASVTISDKKTAEISQGILILLGIEENDSRKDINWLTNKIANLRIFNDENGKMNLSLKDVDGELLIVSQFTLYASTKKGNRPSYIKAAKPETAIPLYENFIKECEKMLPNKVKTGTFGADMKVELVNDGPVTIFIDTKHKE